MGESTCQNASLTPGLTRVIDRMLVRTYSEWRGERERGWLVVCHFRHIHTMMRFVGLIGKRMKVTLNFLVLGKGEC